MLTSLVVFTQCFRDEFKWRTIIQMANNYSTQDLVKGVLAACGERTDSNSPYTQSALKYINNVYKNLLSGANEFAPEIGDAWTWATVHNSFVMPGYYNQNGVNVTQYSPNCSFTVAPTFNNQPFSAQGWFLHVGNENDHTWYEITQHTAGDTAFVIDVEFLEDTVANGSYKIVPVVYDLGEGILRLIEPLRIYKNRVLDYGETYKDQGQIYGINALEFWKAYPMRFLKNLVPSKFTTIFRSEDSWKIQFNTYATNPFKIDWSCIRIPEELTDRSDSIPLVPFEFRDILVYGAAHYLLLDKNLSEKSARYFSLAQAKVQAMHMSEEKMAKLLGVRFGQMTPRLDDNRTIPWYFISS